MEEQIKVLPIVEHIARLQVEFLVMQVARPHVRWRQRKIKMTLGQVSSSLTNSAPSSDMSTSDWSVPERVFAHRIFAFRIFDAACVFCSRFDEDTARSAVFHRFGE